jgi:uracil-DNA glycosylase family protein
MAQRTQRASEDEAGAKEFPVVPATKDLVRLREAAASCKVCPFSAQATQTVFGDGPFDARIVLVGEQPGDQEDRAGRPFVGPAGAVLDRALVEAGVDRRLCYVTNAVKHFKWEPRGKRRLHQKPSGRDIEVCRLWLEAELRSMQPALLVCLGSTAATSIFGGEVKVMRDRGTWRISRYGPQALITVHPSSILRVQDPDLKQQVYADFVADLTLIPPRLAALQ